MTPQIDTRTADRTDARSTTIAQGLLAVALGAFLIYGVGLAQPDVLHAAAHDTRHAAVFPCH